MRWRTRMRWHRMIRRHVGSVIRRYMRRNISLLMMVHCLIRRWNVLRRHRYRYGRILLLIRMLRNRRLLHFRILDNVRRLRRFGLDDFVSRFWASAVGRGQILLLRGQLRLWRFLLIDYLFGFLLHRLTD